MKKSILSILLLFILASCGTTKIIDKPIVFNQERKELTLEYLKDRYNLIQDEPTITPKMVVVHWTAIPTFEKSFDAFYNVKLPTWRPDLENASPLNVSIQFLVDQDGIIYRLMDETTMARHVIGLNYCSIGIENVGGTKDTPLTKKQLKANIKLINYLKEKYPKIEYVIGHFEYTKFEQTDLWLENDINYRTKKTDPGVNFITKIRHVTKKHQWKPIPN
jgi:N-acetyl-anhydromuramyl-L-alanine amidase AmpD